MNSILYDHIGSTYNRTRKADEQIAQQILKKLRPQHGGKYLDLACGTGNYTQEYARQGFSFCGVDQSELMVETAKNKMAEISWRVGDAMALPFAEAQFDGITCTNAIHHFQNLNVAFQECTRVLKAGRLVIFCTTQELMQNYWLKIYFPKMMEKSIVQMPTKNQIEAALISAGFTDQEWTPYLISNDLQDLFLYAGKHRPQLYLSEEFRNNISSFCSFADPAELNSGLKKLSHDIETGEILDVISAAESTEGDYCFISAERPSRSIADQREEFPGKQKNKNSCDQNSEFQKFSHS